MVSSRAKGRVALLLLVLLLASFALALERSHALRVRFWAWRMRSGEIETRRRARLRLLEIGRPEIDSVFADLVVGEALDRVERAAARFAFVGSERARGATTLYDPEPSLLTPNVGTNGRFFLDPPDPDAQLACSAPAARQIFFAAHGLSTDVPHVVLAVPLPADDPLSAAIVEEASARLGARR